jgi:hypothetical protein
MRKRIALLVLLGSLAVCLAGCGGGVSSSTYALTGSVAGPAAARATSDQIQYAAAMDYMVYAADPVTLEHVSAETRTDFRGTFRLRTVPANGDILVIAERDGITLQVCLTEAERSAEPRCSISPDTTIAASVAQLLRTLGLPDEIIRGVYTDCLAYQAANRFMYGHCDGNLCDLTSSKDVILTARELMRASADDVIRRALENLDVEHTTRMVAAGMCDAMLNSACTLKITVAQQTKLAQRTVEGGIRTPTEAAQLIHDAGITTNFGASVTANDVTLARQRLIGKIPALGEGSRPKICAAELLMICTQTGDTAVPFRARTQQQLDDLITLMTTP